MSSDQNHSYLHGINKFTQKHIISIRDGCRMVLWTNIIVNIAKREQKIDPVGSVCLVTCHHHSKLTKFNVKWSASLLLAWHEQVYRNNIIYLKDDSRVGLWTNVINKMEKREQKNGSGRKCLPCNMPPTFKPNQIVHLFYITYNERYILQTRAHIYLPSSLLILYHWS